MGKLWRLEPRHRLLTDFYVFDFETKVTYDEWVLQRKKIDPKFRVPKKSKNKKAIYWGLKGRPENFVFGVIYGYNYQKIFHSLDEFSQILKEKRFKNKLLFAHNAIYDLNVYSGNVFRMDPIAIFNGKFICATDGHCKFADSMNVLGRVPLAKIGTMLGIQKPDLGGKTFYSPNGVGPEEINRCVQDCVITWEALSQVFHGAGDIKITGPSLAMSYFRRFHMPYNIEYNDNVYFFFDSYFGGRTEAFKIGPTNASVIDRNSMYPYEMKVGKFPNPRNLKVERNVKLSYFLNQILPHYEGLIECEVIHHPKPYGYLPYKTSPTDSNNTGKQIKGKLLFPVGRFGGSWNFPEIRYALEQGAIEINKITKIVYADRMPSPFESYVDELYEKKIASKDEFETDRVKHLLNDLYGKFAQKQDLDRTYIDDVEKEFDKIQDAMASNCFVKLEMMNDRQKNGWLVTKNSKRKPPAHSIPSFASYITSYARVSLLKKMNAMHQQRVVYVDTDSVFFEINPGFENERQLGGWKLESKIVTEIRGLKNYTYFKLDEPGILIDRIKGIPKKARLIDGVWHYQNLMNTKEAIRRNALPGILTDRTKVIRGVYDKRIVLPNGDTLPITII